VPYDPAAAGNSDVAAGASRARQHTYKLPDGIPGIGQIQVTVTADSGNALFENNAQGTAEANNSGVLTFDSTIGPYPDLQVTGLTVESTGSLQSGGAVVVRWNDTNSGDRAAQGSWHDRLVIRNATTGEVLHSVASQYNTAVAGNAPVAPGASLARQMAFTLPGGIRGAGEIEFSVTTDVFQHVFEYNALGSGGGSTAEANNVTTLTLASELAPSPDLQVANLAVTPASGLQSGDSFLVTWDARNSGTASVNGTFYSRVTVRNITTNQTLTTADVAYDPTVAGNGALPQGESRQQQFAFTLPTARRAPGKSSSRSSPTSSTRFPNPIQPVRAVRAPLRATIP
jgi:hypothetical protein